MTGLQSVSLDFRVLDHVDRAKAATSYGLYRRLPGNMLEDQRAFVYAVLCITCFNRVRVTAAFSERDAALREDVTYFRLACASLSSWSRASTTALCK